MIDTRFMGKPSETESLVAEISAAVARRLGRQDAAVADLVADEIGRAMADVSAGAAQQQPFSRPQNLSTPNADGRSRVVVTAYGRNRTGIIARLASVIDEFAGDIRDMSQTIVGDYFTLLFVVDISQGGPESVQFNKLRQRVQQEGEDLGVQVIAMHDDILTSMHSI